MSERRTADGRRGQTCATVADEMQRADDDGHGRPGKMKCSELGQITNRKTRTPKRVRASAPDDLRCALALGEETAPFGKTRRNGRGPSTTGLNPRPLGRWSGREERLRQSDTAAANSTIDGAQEKRGQENKLRGRAWILKGEGGTGGEQGDGGHRGPERQLQPGGACGERESQEVATLKGSGDGPNLSPMGPWWPGEPKGDDPGRSPERPCRPSLERELRDGVSDWSCRVWIDGGREGAVKGPVELPGVSSRRYGARRCIYTCDLVRVER